MERQFYTSFAGVWEAMDRVRRGVEEERYLRHPAERLRRLRCRNGSSAVNEP
jgi:hypothetical protein